jgi:NAD(P)-dependent dehydrogenase (short-subunit alcohol dehydrogenase family)
MIEQGRGGRIVNMASQMAAVGYHRRAAYCASKSGVVALSRVLAVEWAPHGVLVNAIGPAFVDWVTYLKVVRAANPADFADQVAQTVGASNDIWLVSAPGYQGFGNDCEALAGDLGATVGYSAHTWVAADPATYYEPMSLIEFSPVHASVSPVRPSQTTPPRPVP